MKIDDNECGCVHGGSFYSSSFVHDSATNKKGASCIAKIAKLQTFFNFKHSIVGTYKTPSATLSTDSQRSQTDGENVSCMEARIP